MSGRDVTGRTSRITAFIIKHNEGTLSQIHDACGDDGRNNTAATLSQMVAAGKLRRTGGYGNRVFHRTPLTGKDLRGTGRQQAEAAARVMKPPPARASTSTAPAEPRALRRDCAPRAVPQTAPSTARAETIEQFLARGGRIQRLPTFASANPLAITHDHDDAWRQLLTRAIG